jgi:hypothetical protein
LEKTNNDSFQQFFADRTDARGLHTRSSLDQPFKNILLVGFVHTSPRVLKIAQSYVLEQFVCDHAGVGTFDMTNAI